MVSVWFAVVVLIAAMIGAFIIGYTAGSKDAEMDEISGELVIAEDEDGIYTFLRLECDPNELKSQKYVKFKIMNK